MYNRALGQIKNMSNYKFDLLNTNKINDSRRISNITVPEELPHHI